MRYIGGREGGKPSMNMLYITHRQRKTQDAISLKNMKIWGCRCEIMMAHIQSIFTYVLSL